jgi:hypothetical protein
LESFLLLTLTAPTKHLLTQLPYSLAGSLANLSRTLAGTASDILASASSAFAKIGASGTRMQSHDIAGSPAGTLTQAPRPFARAFANVFTALADFLARTAISLLLLVLLNGFRLGGPRVLRPTRRARKRGQTEKNHDARRHKCRR